MTKINRNAVLTEAEAEALIREMGYAHAPDLRSRRRRGTGPEHAYNPLRRQKVSYRWGDVLDWLEAGFRNQVKCDLDGTRLGQWILAHKLTVPTFAARVNLSPRTVYKLVGHKNNERMPDASVLQLVALETGIAVGDLAEDAIGIKREDAA